MKYDLSNNYDRNSARLYFDKLTEAGKQVEIMEVRQARTIVWFYNKNNQINEN